MIDPAECPDRGSAVALVSSSDAAMEDLERAVLGDRHKSRFYEALHRLAALYGVEVTKARGTIWDDKHRPAQLVVTTVRFEHRDYQELRKLARARRRRNA